MFLHSCHNSKVKCRPQFPPLCLQNDVFGRREGGEGEGGCVRVRGQSVGSTLHCVFLEGYITT